MAVFVKGGVSGSIQIELKDRMETVNLSVPLRRGALREGRLRAPQGTLKEVFAGKVVANGSALQARPSGSLRWRDGSRYIWQLEQLRVLAKQAPGEVLDALQRGEQPTVFLHLDTTLVDGKLRLRFRDKTSPAWIRS
ncbi:MAG: hypothetical protein N3C12_06935 [Candidatus Binatia bacterium]|nr:hypothetical protein [Candidatus Binatia bacterium]